MRVLHLTDLHLTEPNRTFETLWAGLEKQLRGNFDFVVISGDLTQRAAADEFRLLERFLNDHILPRVGGDRARVVMVPGNHDVDWNEDIGDPAVSVSEAAIASYLDDPEAAISPKAGVAPIRAGGLLQGRKARFLPRLVRGGELLPPLQRPPMGDLTSSPSEA